MSAFLFQNYREMINYWQARGATWVHHGGHFYGAIYWTDFRGRGIALAHINIFMDEARPDMHYHAWVTTEETRCWPDYSPKIQNTPTLGYCYPIERAVDMWIAHTRTFYQERYHENPHHLIPLVLTLEIQ